MTTPLPPPPSAGPRATTGLRPACLMDLGELKAARARYAPLVAYELLTRISVLSDDERGHAHEVEIEYERWRAALQHSYYA